MARVVNLEIVNGLFNDALNEYGAQGYGRDTPAQRLFSKVVSPIQHQTLALIEQLENEKTALVQGMTLWDGDDFPPEDWDHGEVMLRGGRLTTCIHSWCWGRIEGRPEMDIIAYRRKATL